MALLTTIDHYLLSFLILSIKGECSAASLPELPSQGESCSYCRGDDMTLPQQGGVLHPSQIPNRYAAY
jgi:hypothetical protein